MINYVSAFYYTCLLFFILVIIFVHLPGYLSVFSGLSVSLFRSVRLSSFPVCLTCCLSVHLSGHLFPSISLTVFPSICFGVCLSALLFISRLSCCPSVCMSDFPPSVWGRFSPCVLMSSSLSVHLFIHLSVGVSVPSVCLTGHISIHLSVHLSFF